MAASYVQSGHTWVIMWSRVFHKALMDTTTEEDAQTIYDSDLMLG